MTGMLTVTERMFCRSNFKVFIYNEQVATLIDMLDLGRRPSQKGKLQSYKLARPAMKLSCKETDENMQIVADYSLVSFIRSNWSPQCGLRIIETSV